VNEELRVALEELRNLTRDLRDLVDRIARDDRSLNDDS